MRAPAVRGNHLTSTPPTTWSLGLSPHVRGNPRLLFDEVAFGSIARAPGPRCFGRKGLSPHVRGNQLRGGRSESLQGSIPARAGEPEPPSNVAAQSMQGLSPHVRGNPINTGSRRNVIHLSRARVYPRTCGGTHPRSMHPWTLGLSPHVRGNHVRGKPVTGNAPCVRNKGLSPHVRGNPPDAIVDPPWHTRVYPRTCGGTAAAAAAPIWGSIPDVRGNPDLRAFWWGGSIPARAGEPYLAYRRHRARRSMGLSPHVRGNLFASVAQNRSCKSIIPARAGEHLLAHLRGC